MKATLRFFIAAGEKDKAFAALNESYENRLFNTGRDKGQPIP